MLPISSCCDAGWDQYWKKKKKFMEETNIKGTINLLEKAKEKKYQTVCFCRQQQCLWNQPKHTMERKWFCFETYLLLMHQQKLHANLPGITTHHYVASGFLYLYVSFGILVLAKRPDLAIHKFFKLIRQGKVNSIFGNGETNRDYTYVIDIVEGIIAAMHYDKSNYEIIKSW